PSCRPGLPKRRRHRSQRPAERFAAPRSPRLRPQPPSSADSRTQKRRGATPFPAIRIRTSSPDRPRAPPPRRDPSASSLAKQFAKHALLQFRRRALCAAARPQEFQEQLLEIVLLFARRAVLEMRPDLLLELWCQLAVQKLIQMFDAIATIHAGLPLMYPISTA